MDDIEIHVSDEDIRLGAREKCNRCPIALAIRRAVPGSGPSVSEIEIHLTRDGARLVFATPFEAEQFIGRFDGDGDVKPFAFALREADLLSQAMTARAEGPAICTLELDRDGDLWLQTETPLTSQATCLGPIGRVDDDRVPRGLRDRFEQLQAGWADALAYANECRATADHAYRLAKGGF